MPSYQGRHAEYYDLFYREKPYRDEAIFVLDRLQHHDPLPKRKVLELACGTGGHTLQFASHGFDVTALDHSPEMLNIARKKAAQSNVEINFVEADMRRLNLADASFDAAVCLFDSIGYVLTDDALGEVFDGVHLKLRKGGLFIFEFWHAPAMLKYFEPVRIRRFPIENGLVLRISETELEPERSLARVTFSIYDLKNDHTYTYLTETQVNRYFSVSEMDGKARKHGFLPLAFYAGFATEKLISDDTWHVLAVLQADSQ